jgi:hypothetical protein
MSAEPGAVLRVLRSKLSISPPGLSSSAPATADRGLVQPSAPPPGQRLMALPRPVLGRRSVYKRVPGAISRDARYLCRHEFDRIEPSG